MEGEGSTFVLCEWEFSMTKELIRQQTEMRWYPSTHQSEITNSPITYLLPIIYK